MDETRKKNREYRITIENHLHQEIEIPIFQNAEDLEGEAGIQWLKTKLMNLGNLRDTTEKP